MPAKLMPSKPRASSRTPVASMPIIPPTVAVDRVFPAADHKTVQMVIVPAEGDLQYLVQLRHRAVAPHEESASI